MERALQEEREALCGPTPLAFDSESPANGMSGFALAWKSTGPAYQSYDKGSGTDGLPQEMTDSVRQGKFVDSAELILAILQKT